MWQTHRQTHRHTTTAYTALSIASRGKNGHQPPTPFLMRHPDPHRLHRSFGSVDPPPKRHIDPVYTVLQSWRSLPATERTQNSTGTNSWPLTTRPTTINEKNDVNRKWTNEWMNEWVKELMRNHSACLCTETCWNVVVHGLR